MRKLDVIGQYKHIYVYERPHNKGNKHCYVRLCVPIEKLDECEKAIDALVAANPGKSRSEVLLSAILEAGK